MLYSMQYYCTILVRNLEIEYQRYRIKSYNRAETTLETYLRCEAIATEFQVLNKFIDLFLQYVNK